MEIRKQSVHFDADQKLLDFIDRKVNKLETFFDRIVSADIIMRLEKNGQVQDKLAEIKLNVPGNTLIAKETCKSFEEAIDEATEALRRQLIKYKEKMRKHEL